MRVITDLLEAGHNRPGTPLTPRGIVLHSTADPGATALDIRNYFNNNPDKEVSTHLAVDWNQAITMIPWEPGKAEIAWHAGRTANARFLGIEWCESDQQDLFTRAYANFVAVVHTILDWYRWPVDGAHVFSHAQISQMYHETDHIDPLPYLARHGRTWHGLLADIAAATVIVPFPRLPAEPAAAAGRRGRGARAGGKTTAGRRGSDPGPSSPGRARRRRGGATKKRKRASANRPVRRKR